MNLIVCDKHCRHQQEGYCTLEMPAQFTSARDEGCAYYQAEGQAAPADPPPQG